MEKTLTIKIVPINERKPPFHCLENPVVCIVKPPGNKPFLAIRMCMDDYITHWIEGFEFPSEEDEIKEAWGIEPNVISYDSFKKGWLAAKKSLEKP